ncbi:hypothetical protein [Magnetospirillum sp. XM-1]|uniref:hypothetical protein n=1 Tax=Magnetospirillum sp. XM-1 TaxID=1663591 RepID=UPI000839283F|nr:hypothetical protein [Magnetospirillum sp. XM-1]
MDDKRLRFAADVAEKAGVSRSLILAVMWCIEDFYKRDKPIDYQEIAVVIDADEVDVAAAIAAIRLVAKEWEIL